MSRGYLRGRDGGAVLPGGAEAGPGDWNTGLPLHVADLPKLLVSGQNPRRRKIRKLRSVVKYVRVSLPPTKGVLVSLRAARTRLMLQKSVCFFNNFVVAL